MPTALVCRNVGVSYSSYSSLRRLRRRVEVHALKGVDLRLNDGDSLGLIGHNGSGKSTLLQVIAGLLNPTKGEVLARATPRLLGVNAALNNRLTGRQNIEIGCLALGVPRSEIERVAADVAAFAELGDFLDLPVLSYSSGMRQRLAFSISAIVEPEIVLVDEALAVGDRAFKVKCLARLREIRSAAGVVIIATHALNEIQETCNRAIWLHGGEVVLDGEPETVIDAYEHSKRAVNRSLD